MGEPMPERWQPVPGYEGIYEVSTYGQVNSLPRKKTRGGILKAIPGSGGYTQVSLWREGKCRRARIHQLVMEAFAEPPTPGQEIRHLDGDPANNRWAPGSTEEEVRANGGNLFYGTHSANELDKVEHGTHVNGSKTHCPQGHPYDEENTRWYRGMRYCQRCALLRTWKKRGKEPDSPRRRPAPWTHCKRGHEFTPENTYVDPAGHQHCRTCESLRKIGGARHADAVAA